MINEESFLIYLTIVFIALQFLFHHQALELIPLFTVLLLEVHGLTQVVQAVVSRPLLIPRGTSSLYLEMAKSRSRLLGVVQVVELVGSALVALFKEDSGSVHLLLEVDLALGELGLVNHEVEVVVLQVLVSKLLATLSVLSSGDLPCK